VLAKLRQLKIVPSELSGDAEFLRRVTLDAIGTLPAPDEVRAFLADRSPDKRQRKIDALLAHPMHAALWATKFCDITGNKPRRHGGPAELGRSGPRCGTIGSANASLRIVPYDQIARGVLTATSRDSLDLERWLRREVQLNEQVTKGFQTDYADRPSLDLFWRRLANDDFSRSSRWRS